MAEGVNQGAPRPAHEEREGQEKPRRHHRRRPLTFIGTSFPGSSEACPREECGGIAVILWSRLGNDLLQVDDELVRVVGPPFPDFLAKLDDLEPRVHYFLLRRRAALGKCAAHFLSDATSDCNRLPRLLQRNVRSHVGIASVGSVRRQFVLNLAIQLRA